MNGQLGASLLAKDARNRAPRSLEFEDLFFYRDLGVGHYLPTAISLLENMNAAVRLGNFFAILHAFGGSTVGHHYNVGAEHLELIFVCHVRTTLHTSAGSYVVSKYLLVVLRFAFGTDSD